MNSHDDENRDHSRVSDVWVVQQYEGHTLSEHLANGRPWYLDRSWGGLRVVHPTTGDESGFYEGNADAINRNRTAIERVNESRCPTESTRFGGTERIEVPSRHAEPGRSRGRCCS